MDSQQEYISKLESRVNVLEAIINIAYTELLHTPQSQPDTVTISNALDILKPRGSILAIPYPEPVKSPRYAMVRHPHMDGYFIVDNQTPMPINFLTDEETANEEAARLNAQQPAHAAAGATAADACAGNGEGGV